MSKNVRPNVVYILPDQIRATALPIYGEPNIQTPNIDSLAGSGVTLTNAIASAPVCTPYRSMLMTGRHPQTTGHVINFIKTRHDEIGIADAFARAGYRTGYFGKWHLHTGSFPEIDGRDYVPEGRDRLGFQHWRGYNFHTDYLNGSVNIEDWRNENWEGYETEALNRYAFEFIDSVEDNPFFMVISPHQAHWTPYQFAPDDYYNRLPNDLKLPQNVPDSAYEETLEMYRHYLAMILTVDDMVGDLVEHLKRRGKLENTLIIFTSDHGTQVGAHGIQPWAKRLPYEESIRVPWIMRLPGVFDGGAQSDVLTSPVDIFPTLCGLCNIPIPRTVEGYNVHDAWRGRDRAFEQEGILTMGFSDEYDHLKGGNEWRGVRTKDYSYARWLSGKTFLYDIKKDPLQMNNLVGQTEYTDLESNLETMLQALLKERRDDFADAETYGSWFDYQRRVVRNVHGSLGDPEDEPDWSLLS